MMHHTNIYESEVACSIEQNVERDSFLRTSRRQRLTVSANTRISVLLGTTDRSRRGAAGRTHEVRHVRLRDAVERGTRRWIERAFTAAAGKAERNCEHADHGKTEKRAVAE
jgi:hypothetical protein